MLHLPDLDETTRASMLAEFDAEMSHTPHFVPVRLSAYGREVWPGLMREAIEQGDDETLRAALASRAGIFNTHEQAVRNGVPYTKKVPSNAAEMLATSEFNTFYVRGLAARLLTEGVEQAEVYRASQPKWTPGTCAAHEGAIVAVADVYAGHRRGYWPTVNPAAFSVPFGPGCHHSIRRITSTGNED